MSGITYDYMEEYIRGLIPDRTGVLKEIEDFARENKVPIVQKETGKFLEFMVSMKKPLRILELGTAIGFSSILMYEASGNNPDIVTIERDEKMIELANINLKRFNYDRWFLVLGFAVISVILGIVVLLNPFGTGLLFTRMVGLFFTVDGVLSISSIVMLRKNGKFY